ncbi:MAG: FtsX-like permease family protein [Thermoleophilia bacterium]
MTWKLAYRNLFASKLRLILTSLAVILGVGFVVGSFVLGDTMNRSFDNVFATVNKGVAVQVQGVKTVSDADRQPVPASVLPLIRRVDGVASAEGTIGGTVTVLNKDGKSAGLGGPPTLAFNWNNNQDLNPMRILAGHPPVKTGEIGLDKATVDRAKFAVGDTVTVVGATGPRSYTLVAVMGFGSQNSLAGATIVSFTEADAAVVLDSKGRYATISATAKPGVSSADLAKRVGAVLPKGYEAITGAEATKQSSDQLKSFVDIFRNILLGFGVISVFVGSFIIFNAFKITVAQRTRQVGLRGPWSTPSGMIVRSVMLESLLTGLIASVLGIGFGVLTALGLRAVFNAIGLNLPSTTLQVHTRTVVVGLVVGVVVTLLAALGPSVRSSRVPPMAALRDIEVHSSPRIRAVLSIVLTALGVLLIILGLRSNGGLAQAFSLIGGGAVFLFIGAAMLTQYVSRPLARAIGAPLARLGLAGRLGQENAMRNPSRTAQTAAALTIGVALVTGVSVVGASLSKTFVGTLDTRVHADLITLSSDQQPFSNTAAAVLRTVPGVGSVTSWRDGQFKDPFGNVQQVAGVDPAVVGQMYDAGVQQGALTDLSAPETIAISRTYADHHHLKVGSNLTALFAKSGSRPLRVAAVFKDKSFGEFYISLASFQQDFTTQQDSVLLARAAPGADVKAVKAAASDALKPFGNLDVRTKAEYKNFVNSQINGLLRFFWMLLAFAVIIALFGIVLALALSVFERTREIGLLRAVGLSRRSLRNMIRAEGLIVAVIGGVVGLVLGVFLGLATVKAIPDFTETAVPWGSMLIFLVVAGVLGVLAAMWPARRAARLNVLQAIAQE